MKAEKFGISILSERTQFQFLCQQPAEKVRLYRLISVSISKVNIVIPRRKHPQPPTAKYIHEKP